ncbi:hypothetical protein [Labrys wisconsinensis]|uniref:Glucose dehydrogenase n=1 Tax=Labrys wisconsinensis TaxID=425677 RepID=A0ABU0JHQ5_9HYPH|nr:hypothetical protein [Labrys wisconsinensis]MDQ0473817.1 glucose dehydrogenase [Labrys wisconsinensis]
MSRGAGTAVGVLLILTGLVWAGQGLGLIGGSFMTGQTRWLVIGLAVASVGAALLAFVRRRGG